MSVGSSNPEHPIPTRNGRRYLFSDKHHDGRDPDAARWLPSMTQNQEFAVFDDADFHDLSDGRNLYGLRPRDASGHIPDLGTWGQQVAEFSFARPGEAWHGYPLWPLVEAGPENRRGEKARPAMEVFRKMEAASLITAVERKRLSKGHHI